MTNQEQVLAALPHLPADVLAKVRDAATVLLAVGPKKASPRSGDGATGGVPEDFARALYDAIADAVAKRTRVKATPFHVFSRSATYHDKFLPAAEAAAEANGQWFPKQSKSERASMAALYATLTLDYLDSRRTPVLWPTIAVALASLPAVVDRAFPGYAAAGLLGKIQQLRTRPRPPV